MSSLEEDFSLIMLRNLDHAKSTWRVRPVGVSKCWIGLSGVCGVVGLGSEGSGVVCVVSEGCDMVGVASGGCDMLFKNLDQGDDCVNCVEVLSSFSWCPGGLKYRCGDGKSCAYWVATP